MSGKTPQDRYRILFVVWTLAATSMALGVLRMLPDVNPFILAILALSAINVFIWRKAYRRQKKLDDEQRPQTKLGRHNKKLRGGKRT